MPLSRRNFTLIGGGLVAATAAGGLQLAGAAAARADDVRLLRTRSRTAPRTA